VLSKLKKNLLWLEIEHVLDLDKTHAKHYVIIGRKK